MNRNYQIMRGLERLMCAREGERLQGLYGLSGLGTVETFADLRTVLGESGFVDVETFTRGLEQRHRRDCDKIAAALPVAVTVTKMLQAASDNPQMLNGIFSKVGKALKKIVKASSKLSLSHLLVKKVPALAKLSPSQKLLLKLDKPKVKAVAAAVDAGVTPTTPALDAGAAVLTNESGVPLVTPAAQDFAQQLVASGAGGGSTAPAASMYDAPPDGAADDGTILGMQPMVAAGAGVAALGTLYLLTRKRKGR